MGLDEALKNPERILGTIEGNLDGPTILAMQQASHIVFSTFLLKTVRALLYVML